MIQTCNGRRSQLLARKTFTGKGAELAKPAGKNKDLHALYRDASKSAMPATGTYHEKTPASEQQC